MKKLLFIAAAVLLFAACGKAGFSSDDGNITTTTSTVSIVGKWYYTLDTVRTYSNDTLKTTNVFNYHNTDYLQFNSDGTGVKQADTTTTNFTYIIIGQTLTLHLPSAITVSSIHKTQDTRTDVLAGVNQSATIRQLTATNLALFFPKETTTNSTETVSEAVYLSR
jgi:hypothetical protein